jgi:hypothetical protein
VTAYNKLWNQTVQSMYMTWDVEVKGSVKRLTWKSDKMTIPSTWKVTHWADMPSQRGKSR